MKKRRDFSSKRKNKFYKKIIYNIDQFISMGTGSQFILLIICVLLIILTCGILVGVTNHDISIGMGIWHSLTHLLDQGTITADDTSDKFYLTIMFIITILGLLIMGTIIGIMDNAIRARLDFLNKGISQVIEEGHIVVIGYNDNTSCIVRQQMKSNENWLGNRSIVILDDKDMLDMKKEMNDNLNIDYRSSYSKKERKKKKKSKIIFRSGVIISESSYDMVSLDKAKSIIINLNDDFEVIRVILAITNYFRKKNIFLKEEMPNVVTLMHNSENIVAAKVAAGLYDKNGVLIDNKETGRIQIMYIEDILARIFAQVCRQPGLSWVLSELFDYDNSEIYIEGSSRGVSLQDMGFVGKKFNQICKELETSIGLGIQKSDGKILLNPAPDTIFEKNDKIIHLAYDDNEILVNKQSVEKKYYYGYESDLNKMAERPYNIIIFGWSVALKDIIKNIDDFAISGSKVCIITDNAEYVVTGAEQYKNIKVDHVRQSPYDWKFVEGFLEQKRELCKATGEKITNILLLCQDNVDKEEADRRTAVLLLNIRTYLKKHDRMKEINLTTEMNLVEDQTLLQSMEVNDFVVGAEIANRIMVQVANNPDIYEVFYYLLSDIGPEIYLRYIEDYVDINQDFTFDYLFDVAMTKENETNPNKKHEIVMGWIRYDEEKHGMEIRLNPKAKPQQIIYKAGDFGKKDRLIVLAED